MIDLLFTHEQLKHLVPDGEDKFKYVEEGVATEEEKQALREMDADFFELCHEHIITNPKDIK